MTNEEINAWKKHLIPKFQFQLTQIYSISWGDTFPYHMDILADKMGLFPLRSPPEPYENQ